MAKKFLTLFLSVIMLLCFVACGENAKDDTLSIHGKKVYDTENITRITFYGNYGDGEGKDVPEEYMHVITSWLGSFNIGEKGDKYPPPGTNTHYVEIEYSNGRIIKNGLDRISIDGVVYKLEKDNQPQCFFEIVS